MAEHAGEFPGFISEEMFKRARVIRQFYGRFYRDEEWMLDGLRVLLRKHGRLNMQLIAADKGIPSVPAYVRHFGSLRGAYERIGYRHRNDWMSRPDTVRRHEIAKQIVDRIISEVREAGGAAHWSLPNKRIALDPIRSIAVLVGRSLVGRHGRCWEVQSTRWYTPTVTVLVRMNDANAAARDYLCFRRSAVRAYLNRKIRDDDILDAYLCPTLDGAIIRAIRETADENP